MTLHRQRYGAGPRPALAVHGITASSAAWAAVGAALPEEWSLVAVDLRGRGHSRDLPSSTGLQSHVDDLVPVAEELAAGGPVPLVGHSMGAYVAVHLAHERPDLFSRVVLVDGGVALPLPADADPDAVLAATLGPALERLSRSCPTVEAYVDVFRAHPALGPHWSTVVEGYARYDALETPDGVRSRCDEESVRADGRDLLVSGAVFDSELRSVGVPVTILAAPGGMLGEPPGLLPVAALTAYDEVPGIDVEVVPDTNHYTIVFAPAAAARVAAVVSGGAA
ncbi:alpha/beta hydrolase [Nocardioides anomalus]|uniref:Alpha/beta hydrolase n=1 Tax=Nocardioides anomalus TaxID=2712223 RepID=A0A6G6WJE3_9ACTN|nr:alpha/beta hydrolase [Nocardioides anomalus]QIG45326.1 alpha/beta hydrolase [Nocardioides anomalus]